MSVKEPLKMSSDYDSYEDVLYISLTQSGKPQEAHDSRRIGNVILRYSKIGALIGITIIDLKDLLVTCGKTVESEKK